MPIGELGNVRHLAMVEEGTMRLQGLAVFVCSAHRARHDGACEYRKRPDSPDSRILEAIETGEVRLTISDRYLIELLRVTSRREVEAKIGSPARAFKMGLDIGVLGLLERPCQFDWPNLRDPNDSWMLDLALESEADYIVTRDKGVIRDAPKSGFEVLTPPVFVRRADL